jgi:O-antigen/teichoic acid export membrane protein
LYYDIKKILPNLSFRLRFEKETFFKLLKFSGYKFIGNTGGQIVFQLDKLILGFFHPISYVTFYTVPVTLIQKAFSLMLNITNAVFPALSHSFTTEDKDRSRQLYLRMGKFIVFIMTPIMILLFIFADQILLLWLNEEFVAKSAMTLRILSVAYFIAALSAPGVIASDASGNPKLPAIFSSISAFINVIAAFILIPIYGIEGAAYALLINFLSQVPIFIFIVNKTLMKISNLEFISQSIFKPLVSGILAGLICIVLNNFVLMPLIKLLLGSFVFGICYLVINFMIGTFDQHDRTTINFLISKLRRTKNV